MATERKELHLQDKPQTPDQHPLTEVHGKAKFLLDLYTKKRTMWGATSSRITWPDNGIETYRKHPDGSRGLIAHFSRFTIEVTERVVIDEGILDGKVSESGNVPVTALEKIIYSDSEFNLKDSEEAFEMTRHSIITKFPGLRVL